MTAYADIPTTMLEDEFKFLVRHARKAVRGMIEIGSAWGKSSINLGRVAQDKGLLLTCVDTWEGEDFYNGWVDNIKDAGLSDDVTPIRMQSKDAFRAVAKDFMGKCDFLFIDADHSYEAVNADFKNWSSLLARPAIVVFHDIEVPCYGVMQFYGELSQNHKHKEQDNIGAIFLK